MNVYEFLFKNFDLYYVLLKGEIINARKVRGYRETSILHLLSQIVANKQ